MAHNCRALWVIEQWTGSKIELPEGGFTLYGSWSLYAAACIHSSETVMKEIAAALQKAEKDSPRVVTCYYRAVKYVPDSSTKD